MVTIYTFVELESPMMYAKFQDHRTSGSGEEDFLKVFTIYGNGSHLGHVTWAIYTNFCSPFPFRLHCTIRFFIDNNVNILSPNSKTIHTKFTIPASF